MDDRHEKFLRRAVELAARGKHLFPNPRVGCVVVQKGKMIARGWHAKFGGPHAEVIALDALRKGERRGATVYVSMEPCADWKGKKTPSCAKRLARERVATVIVGMRDPHPHVRGKGIALLERAGITVVVAPPRVAVFDANHDYVMRIAQQSDARPFVLMKTAMSVDGKIGTPDHRAALLSTPEDRRAVDRLRAACDAIMVGGTTLRNDKPRLTVKDPALIRRRIAEGCDPQSLPVAIVSEELLVGRDPVRYYVVGKKHGNLHRALSILAIRYGVRTLMLEGGGELNFSMLAHGFVDLMRVATAPVILGGRTAPTLVDGEGFAPPYSLQLLGREKKGAMDIAWYTDRFDKKCHPCYHAH